ncbi:MAG: SIMPL domain-containing protein [Candidatus Paceibacterota bacterium]
MEPSFFSSKTNRTLGSLVLIALLVSLIAYAGYTLKQAKYMYSGPTTITVLGTGEVKATPDIGQFNFSVMAEGEDAGSAQQASDSKIKTIFDYLKNNGVEEKDIKTSFYNLNPKYRYENQLCVEGQYCSPNRVQDGFEVNQMVTVKVRDLDKAGMLLAGVGDFGATNISGLQFTIDDTDILKEQARAIAIADAKAKAKTLASELGVRVVKMVGYYENENGPMPYYGYGGDMAEEAMVKNASLDSVSVAAGENTVTSNVNITYQVR